jgi:hypothetical protein
MCELRKEILNVIREFVRLKVEKAQVVDGVPCTVVQLVVIDPISRCEEQLGEVAVVVDPGAIREYH